MNKRNHNGNKKYRTEVSSQKEKDSKNRSYEIKKIAGVEGKVAGMSYEVGAVSGGLEMARFLVKGSELKMRPDSGKWKQNKKL